MSALPKQQAPRAQEEQSAANGLVAASTLSLPKGGGAIKGMDEKFAANPVTGTGAMTVPIATSPGRAGFGPHLALSYDSGAGNGPFGFGWTLSLPAITRKTEKGLPQYRDADESDVFLLAGAEDLVPVYRQDPDGSWVASHGGHHRNPDETWVRDSQDRFVMHEDERDGYIVRRYRPRIEGLFARIERWTKDSDPGDVHWRSLSKDNILTIYGKDANSRIFDPEHPSHIFTWLICETRDDKGNVALYTYKAEDGVGVDLTKVHERNRGGRNHRRRTANRYLKQIRYGNWPSLLDVAGNRPRFLTSAQIEATAWLFEVLFDYGEHDPTTPTPDDVGDWDFRPDPFSTYRAGFEVRTTRLCRRVLMYHHIPDLPAGEPGYDGLVRSTDFTYSHRQAPTSASNPIYTFLAAVTQTGYKRVGDGYLKRSLPPVEFEYSQPVVQDRVEEVDGDSLENLPIGLDGATYQWTDLHGEGIPGILTEQGGAWFYKRNLSPLTEQNGNDAPHVTAKFAPLELVGVKPNLALAGGAQFMDLAGDGQPDLVVLDGPVVGFYEHDGAEGWRAFRPFTHRLTRDLRDPNLKFVDLDGDGHADVLISEDEALVWHPSLGEAGFDAACRVQQALDEEQGPRLLFADGAQSIYLADLSGDGLTDLVRIRNGEICYWPNLGYGRFGAKVTMDNAPWFDTPDLFDHKRIRLADIDGSGTTDILYLHGDGVRLYFNQSGNSWSAAQVLRIFPRVDDLAAIIPVDLLGNGTACLVWSSPLPGDAQRPLRYVNLMGGQKPHLLIKIRNNLGAETVVHYAPSTKFYLVDKLAGTPWITKLPFPVHVVEKVTVTDSWRQTAFTTTYSYHHGYFDGEEREFRGFGRVDRVDVEDYGAFSQGNSNSPYITVDQRLYQPPVKTITWFHTGVALDRDRILSHFAAEYFPHWFERLRSGDNVLGGFVENALPEPDLTAAALTAAEWREALRACKGMALRQEVYELDVDALREGEERRVKLFSAAMHNCQIQRLQPQANNRHGVFLVTESEAITYHYELDLRPATIQPDPRIAHTLNLNTDEFGNILQAVAVAYPRRLAMTDASLEEHDINHIRAVQRETHLAYTENRYTNDAIDDDNHRLRLPCEVLTYELTGLRAIDPNTITADARIEFDYFTLAELRSLRLSAHHQAADPRLTDVPEIAYHELPSRPPQPPDPRLPQKRCVEHVRMLFFDRNLRDPLRLGQLNALALPYETYTLALTEALLRTVFADKLDTESRDKLNDAQVSGYLSGTRLAERFRGIDTTGQYWRRAGIPGFAADAADHFYLPERYTDPFGNVTTLTYDERDLYVKTSGDALGNTTHVTAFDWRVLAPRALQDPNDNSSEVYFDVLGLPTAVAVKGKGDEGDNLTGFDDLLANPDPAAVAAFFTSAYDEGRARDWLGNATARHVYHFGEERNPDGSIRRWGAHPAGACAIVREQHVAQLEAGQRSPLQVAFEYSDGSGNVLVKKVQAEPESEGGPLRWIANGKTVLNNKGKPVKQYEPYFSLSGHHFEEPIEVGVTPILYYDAVSRLIRTEAPDGSYSRVEFSPWHVTTYDQNDILLEAGNAWYARHTEPTAAGAETRAAGWAIQAANTPALTFLDSLGRDVVAVAHNRRPTHSTSLTVPWRNEKYLTFTKLDAEGKALWIRDARRNLVMQYITPPVANNQTDDPVSGFAPCYDIAGNLLFQHSMDGGDRWLLHDAAGKPMLAWDLNERQTTDGPVTEARYFVTAYDALHRPTAHWLTINGGAPQLIERFHYGEPSLPETDPGYEAADREAKQQNLRGQLHQHYGASGLVSNVRFDFKGNLLETRRTLASDYQAPVIDWADGSPTATLEPERWTQITEYDALNRMTRQYNWHQGVGSRVAVYEPRYNERGLLAGEDLVLHATKTDDGYREEPRPPAERPAQRTTPIRAIEYDAKGQKTLLHLGNGTLIRYIYDPLTFRLQQLRTTRPDYYPPFPEYHSNLRDPGVLQQLFYTYDAVGNIMQINDEAYMPVYFQNQVVRPESCYVYDALYRLIDAVGQENATHAGTPPQLGRPTRVGDFPMGDRNALRPYRQIYRYDAVGNILLIQHITTITGRWTRRYSYAADSNRLLRTWEGAANWDDSNATNQVSYAYDTHGNMLNLNRVPEEYRLRWDYRDMIGVANLGGGGWAYYNYAAGKERTRKVITDREGNKQWERLYLGGMEVYRRYRGTEVVEEIETHHLFIGEQRVLLVEDVLKTDNEHLTRGPLFRYQYSNHLGSACVELDPDAAIISYEEYHPYGTTAYLNGRGVAEVSLKRYRYTGKERDEETGLSYHSARYYAPWLARWVTPDPAGMSDGPNVHVYARGNPLVQSDPNGLQAQISGANFNYPDSVNWEHPLLNETLHADHGGWQRAGNQRYMARSVVHTLGGIERGYRTTLLSPEYARALAPPRPLFSVSSLATGMDVSSIFDAEGVFRGTGGTGTVAHVRSDLRGRGSLGVLWSEHFAAYRQDVGRPPSAFHLDVRHRRSVENMSLAESPRPFAETTIGRNLIEAARRENLEVRDVSTQIMPRQVIVSGRFVPMSPGGGGAPPQTSHGGPRRGPSSPRGAPGGATLGGMWAGIGFGLIALNIVSAPTSREGVARAAEHTAWGVVGYLLPRASGLVSIAMLPGDNPYPAEAAQREMEREREAIVQVVEPERQRIREQLERLEINQEEMRALLLPNLAWRVLGGW